MASLGATTFTSVTWTTGDVITETKKDNEMANQQAYDSHAGNGYLSNNDVGFWCKEVGGTNRVLAHVDTSDIGQFGDTSLVENAMNTRAKAKAYLSGVQSIASGSDVKITLDTESYDIGSDFDTGNNKFVTPVAGYYLICATVAIDDLDDNDAVLVKIYTGGASSAISSAFSAGAGNVTRTCVSDVQEIAATVDIELYARQTQGGNQNVLAATDDTYLAVHLLSIGA